MSTKYCSEQLRQHNIWKASKNRITNYIPKPKNILKITSKISLEPSISAESLWADWIKQMHLADAYKPIDTEPPLSVICDEVRAQFGIRKMDFISARRSPEFVLPRQIAMSLARHLTTMSLPQIGKRMGNRDHTTVLHGCRKLQPVMNAVAAKLEPNSPVCMWVSMFRKELKITECYSGK